MIPGAHIYSCGFFTQEMSTRANPLNHIIQPHFIICKNAPVGLFTHPEDFGINH